MTILVLLIVSFLDCSYTVLHLLFFSQDTNCKKISSYEKHISNFWILWSRCVESWKKTRLKLVHNHLLVGFGASKNQNYLMKFVMMYVLNLHFNRWRGKFSQLLPTKMMKQGLMYQPGASGQRKQWHFSI